MQSAPSRILYRRSNGQPLSIRDDNLIGSGGEGSIYTLDEIPDLVAKVYHSPSRLIGAKLTLMVDNPPTMPERDGHVSIAWPLDTLHGTRTLDNGSVVGFLMPRISSMQPVNQSYNPAARKRNFPHYTYRHLCTVAINIAIAVNSVHGRNYVIGDINESNIMINDSGLVTLIDTDSFQVIDQSDGTIHRSPVGKPEYTSQELQGHSFDAVDRDLYHDRFGLGVIIYQLLMEGRHPYTGRYTGRGEPPPIEGNIARGHFLHSENRVVPLVDGPGYMPWLTLDESIRELFGLCFERGHDNQIVRPTPSQWEQVITSAVGSLVTCTQNAHHLYFGHNPTCPWCDRRDMLRGRDPFPELPGPEPLLMRAETGDHTAALGGRAPPAPQPQRLPPAQPAQRPPPQRPAPQRPAPQPQPRGRATLGGIPLPSDPKSAWAVLLLIVIVIGVSLASWGVASLIGFLESDPLGSDGPVSAAAGGGPVPSLPPAPTSLPVAAPAIAALPPTETPTPTRTVEPTPTDTPLPPSQTPLPLVVPPPPSATPTPEPTPTREPIPVMPDLRLDVGSFAWHPENPSVGDPVIFSIIVKNEGGNAAPSRLGYRIYSVNKHAEPVLEGGVDVPDILAGGQTDVSFDWTAQAGLHSLEIEVYVKNQVDESAEGNNAETQFLYNGTALADLVVESIGWSPDAPAMGDIITFHVTVSNKGEGRAGASMVELNVDNDLLDRAELPPITPGESETASFRWNARIGAYPLRVLVDSDQAVSETDEGNNNLVKAYEATTFADLIVERISWEPLNPSVGDEVTFTVTVVNQGTLPVGGSTVEFARILQDGTVSSSEGHIAGILAGGSATATFQWQAEPGEITLTARADIQGTVRESDEDNNHADGRYDGTQLADLVVVGIALEPDHPAFGEDVTVTMTLENVGDGDASASDVRLFIDGIEHDEATALPALSAGNSETVSFTWVAEMGIHTFRADVDHSERVVESDDTNNESEMFKYDDTRVADLIVSATGWEPENPSVGDTVTFGVLVENRGDAAAQDFHVSFRDQSSVWPPMEKMASGDLAPGRKTTVSFEWPAEADTHQFAVVADSRKEVTESDENNNEHTFDYDATVAADLVVSGITASPRRPSVDEDTTIKVTVNNEGQGRSGSSIVTLTIAGPDGEVDQSNRRVEEIAAGGSRTLEFQWEAKAGSHTFTAAVDSRGVVAETDESNNVLTEEIVTALSDLIATEVQVYNLSPSAGDEVEIGVRVQNVGRGNSGRFTISLYVDGADQPYSGERIGSLDRNASTYMEFKWRAEEGCHRFHVVVDGDDDVPEEDEGNNRSQKFELCVGANQ